MVRTWAGRLPLMQGPISYQQQAICMHTCRLFCSLCCLTQACTLCTVAPVNGDNTDRALSIDAGPNFSSRRSSMSRAHSFHSTASGPHAAPALPHQQPEEDSVCPNCNRQSTAGSNGMSASTLLWQSCIHSVGCMLHCVQYVLRPVKD